MNKRRLVTYKTIAQFVLKTLIAMERNVSFCDLQNIYSNILLNSECSLDVPLVLKVLSLPSLNEDYANFNLHEKEKLLLKLTILEIIHQKSRLETASETLIKLGNQTANKKTILSLVQLSCHLDPLISYSSGKTLIFVLINLPFQIVDVEILISKILQLHDATIQANLLDLLRLLLSQLHSTVSIYTKSSVASDLLKLALLTISEHWSVLLEYIFVNRSNTINRLVNSFLLLWLKILKIHDSLGSDFNSEALSIFCQPSDILSACRSSSSLTSKLSIDVINYMLRYDASLIASQKLSYAQLSLAFNILVAVKNNLLLQIPFHEGFISFGGTLVDLNPNYQVNAAEYIAEYTGDKVLLRKLTLVIFKSLSALCKSDYVNLFEINDVDVLYVVEQLQDFFSLKLCSKITKYGWLLDLYADQDDSMIEILLVLLVFYSSFIIRLEDQSRLSFLNPHILFNNFLILVSFDHTVLLDYLVSNETCFLCYLTCYLKLIISNWNSFSKIHLQIFPELKSIQSESVSTSHHIAFNSEENTLAVPPKYTSNCISDSLAVKNELKSCNTMDKDFKTSLTSASHTQMNISYTDSNIQGMGTFSCLGYDNKSDISVSKEKDNVLAFKGIKLCDYDSSGSSDNEIDKFYNESLTRCMDTLTSLKSSIKKLLKKNLFPYSVGPLLSLLQKCEDLYEQ